MTVTDEQARAWARIAHTNLTTEFPHATQQVVRGPDEPSRPRVLHPSFHGSFDWHSAVHMHWLLVSLLSTHRPALGDVEDDLVALLDDNLGQDALAVEAAYLQARRSFERPYGWAWLLALHAAAVSSKHPAATRWASALTQTSAVLAESVRGWAASALPIRHGVHTNSAFAAVLLRTAAPLTGYSELVPLLDSAARRWFGDDHDAPVHTEPSAHDFLSPALGEADLMRRVLDPAEFTPWLRIFFPGLDEPSALDWLRPGQVADPSDSNQVHLYGLGLSRAWQLDGLAGVVDDPAVAERLRAAAAENLAAGLAATDAEGEFMSDHWLASFAYLAIQRPF